MKKIRSIEKLKETYGDGEDLEIRIDNDCTYVTDVSGDIEEDEYGDTVTVFDGEGYQDVYELWKRLFPEADVEGV